MKFSVPQKIYNAVIYDRLQLGIENNAVDHAQRIYLIVAPQENTTKTKLTRNDY